MKALTTGQMQALLNAIDAGVFNDTYTPELQAAVRKLRESVTQKKKAQRQNARSSSKEVQNGNRF